MGPHPLAGTISFALNGYEPEKHGEAVRINVRGKALAVQYLLPGEPDNDNEKGGEVSKKKQHDTVAGAAVSHFVDVTSLSELNCVL